MDRFMTAAATALLPGTVGGVSRGVERLASACFVLLPTTLFPELETLLLLLVAVVVLGLVMFKPPGPNVSKTGMPCEL